MISTENWPEQIARINAINKLEAAAQSKYWYYIICLNNLVYTKKESLSVRWNLYHVMLHDFHFFSFAYTHASRRSTANFVHAIAAAGACCCKLRNCGKWTEIKCNKFNLVNICDWMAAGSGNWTHPPDLLARSECTARGIDWQLTIWRMKSHAMFQRIPIKRN